MKTLVNFMGMALLAFACGTSSENTKQQTNEKSEQMHSKLDPKKFERTLPEGDVRFFLLKNKNRLEMTVTNYGGRILELFTPDKDGNFEDINLGFDNLDDYMEAGGGYFGAPIGRYGNRIANAQFTLDGKTYQLEANNGPNNLHGWPGGYHAVVWEVLESSDQLLKLKYISADGQAGFPGNLTVIMTYELTDDNEFKIGYEAETDQKTIVNLTHHGFYNLNGHGNGNVHNHLLTLNADYFTPVNEVLIPTGEIAPVAGTPMDFRTPHLVGDRIDDDYPQLKIAGGYDHNWVLNKKDTGNKPELAATVVVPENGRKMEVFTSQPGVQIYTGNFMNGQSKSKEGKIYEKRGAICLETQHFPDSPNQPNFPSVVLNPGETYQHVCIYKFSVEP
ncbi:MAG: galactose mutarotase [Lunatimonas sp.]|uniref:aldose epimerase family protein n=1 Tax=Lunatimonas sp. TaxID=2060141 RepID=UPI00263B0844|nr:aldose epimerase family protein [Lunatimonas sp.]MCC5939468.1 galactose mutarotase [Lunatimonas sp.]